MKNFIFKTIIMTAIVSLAIVMIGKSISGLTWSVRSVTIPKEEPFQVSAQGEIYVKPDTAEIVLGVEKEAKSATEAQKLINEINNNLIQSLKKLGVEEEKIKTTNYNIYPRYEWDSNNKRRLVGYQASASILVKTKDFEKINQIIDEGVNSGANQINSLNFVLEDEDQAKAEARNQAIKKAKKKAEEIAKISGLNLGKLINVSVLDQGNNYPVPRIYDLGGAQKSLAMEEATQVEAGETKISVSVVLSYEIK